MDFNNIFKPDEAPPEAVADVERWLKEMESRGLTVTDPQQARPDHAGRFYQAVQHRKIETGKLDVKQIYENAFPFRLRLCRGLTACRNGRKITCGVLASPAFKNRLL